jgi:hypothetical protein
VVRGHVKRSRSFLEYRTNEEGRSGVFHPSMPAKNEDRSPEPPGDPVYTGWKATQKHSKVGAHPD